MQKTIKDRECKVDGCESIVEFVIYNTGGDYGVEIYSSECDHDLHDQMDADKFIIENLISDVQDDAL